MGVFFVPRTQAPQVLIPLGVDCGDELMPRRPQPKWNSNRPHHTSVRHLRPNKEAREVNYGRCDKCKQVLTEAPYWVNTAAEPGRVTLNYLCYECRWAMETPAPERGADGGD